MEEGENRMLVAVEMNAVKVHCSLVENVLPCSFAPCRIVGG